MNIQNILNWFNPKKKAWWRKDEWVQYNRGTVYILDEVHDCPSYDFKCYLVRVYKNKNTCEERVMKDERMEILDTTVFDKNKVKNAIEVEEEEFFYQGSKYE